MASRRVSVCLIARNGIFQSPAIPRRGLISIPYSMSRQFQTTPTRYAQQANTKSKRDPAPKVQRGDSKLYKDADAAVADLQNGSTILSAGFGLCGTAGLFYSSLPAPTN